MHGQLVVHLIKEQMHYVTLCVIGSYKTHTPVGLLNKIVNNSYSHVCAYFE